MQSNTEAERQIKYDMLKEEILDKGYDPLAFQIFCETIKKDGSDDVDSWTVEELKETISQFKVREDQYHSHISVRVLQSRKSIIDQRKPKQDLSQSQIEEESKQQQEIQETPTKVGSKDFVVSKQIDEVNFKTEIECRRPERTKLIDFFLENPHKKLDIVMNEYMTKSEGLFSTGYGAFRVNTHPLGWVVWRRFSDFAWLRQVLNKAYPCQLVPPIPSKKIKVNATEASHLEKRMKVMELFLQNLLHHPMFRTHPAFADFLSITDNTQFKERIVHYERLAPPQRPSEFVTPSGKCVLEISPELSNYTSTLHDYLKNSAEMYSKLQDNFKKFFLDLDSLSSTLSNIQEQFTSLSKITDLFCKTNYNQKFIGQVEQVHQVYNQLSTFMEGWYQNVLFQMKNVKENFYEFFSYHKQMQDQALEFVNHRNSLNNKYRENKNKLNEKKEKLFAQGDTNKWDLPVDIPKTIKELQFNKQEAFKYILPNESRQLNDLKENFAYINRQTIDEMNQVMLFRIESYASKFIRVAQMRGLDIAKLHHIIADFLTNMFELQGEQSGSMQKRQASIFIDPKYDKFFGVKPVLDG